MAEDMKVRDPRWVRARIHFDLFVSPDWQNQVLDEVKARIRDEFALGISAQYACAEEYVALPVVPAPRGKHVSPVDHAFDGKLDDCLRCGYKREDHERMDADNG